MNTNDLLHKMENQTIAFYASRQQKPMNRCVDCKHWSDSPQKPNSDLRVCRRIHYFNSISKNEDIVDIENDYGAADLLSGPQFGCVLFESKESK